MIFFSIWVFFHEYSRITGLQGKEKSISLIPHYHFFHPLHRHLGISRANIAGSSPLTYLTAGLEPRTFGFPAQVANHYATRPKRSMTTSWNFPAFTIILLDWNHEIVVLLSDSRINFKFLIFHLNALRELSSAKLCPLALLMK